MTTTPLQQEVLLFTNTQFASQDYQKISGENNQNESKIERLKEACWNGLIDELLPEILKERKDQKINLWNIHVASSFLDLQFSSFPGNPDELSSVNPYLFLPHQYYN